MELVVKPLTARSAQPHINAEQVKSLPIIQTPLDLQNRFAEFVRQADKSKFELQRTLDELETTYKALLKEHLG
jgi:type I restriction enzyme S subunit